MRQPRLAPLLLVVATLLLSGCVYLRLLELKLQLNRFDDKFALQTEDGLGIVCHDPVLKTSDVRWIGLYPASVNKLGRAEQWRVRWVKVLPPEVTEPAEFDIVLDLGFANDRLTRVTIPERYFKVMPKQFVIGVIKSLARGKIDQGKKQIDAKVAAADIAAARPSLPAIDKLLGLPSEEHEEGTTTLVRYQYIPDTREAKAGVFDMLLTFDTKSGELLRWRGKTPVGTIGFDFSADKKAK